MTSLPILPILPKLSSLPSFRSDCVFMSRLVDRGRPRRQEIILNCVLQIQKYKVGEIILTKKLTIAIYDDHKNCGFVRFVFLSAKRCLVKTLSDKEDEFKLSLKVKKEQCNFQGLFVWTVFVFPKTYTYCIEELGLYLCFLKHIFSWRIRTVFVFPKTYI